MPRRNALRELNYAVLKACAILAVVLVPCYAWYIVAPSVTPWALDLAAFVVVMGDLIASAAVVGYLFYKALAIFVGIVVEDVRRMPTRRGKVTVVLLYALTMALGLVVSYVVLSLLGLRPIFFG